MVSTRASTSAQATSSRVRLEESHVAAPEPEAEPEREADSDIQNVPNIQELLSELQRGFKTLKRKLTTAKDDNERLRADLARIIEEGEGDASLQPRRGKRGAPSVGELRGQIRALKDEVRELEKAREKDRKKIKSLQRKEIKKEAAELQEEAEGEGDDDEAHRMRKLLRRFQDLMDETTLDESETCPICFEPMKPKKCSSFPCEHIVCDDCLPGITNLGLQFEAEMFTCPMCRKPSSREAIVSVTKTATQQWDELLNVAATWADIDRRPEVDSSEEEEEENAIVDGDESESGSGSRSESGSASATRETEEKAVAPGGRIESSPEAPDEAATPPSASDAQGPTASSYASSPSAAKRKRMQELAETRSRKQRR